jgi:hypothetical protein
MAKPIEGKVVNTDMNEALPVGSLKETGTALAQAVMTYEQLVAKYEPVSLTEKSGLVVTGAEYPILDKTPERPSYRELGTTGQTNYGFMVREDYNPELRGLAGLTIFDKMRKSDGQVRATLRLVKTPVLAARWYIEPGSDKRSDRKIGEHISDNLFKWMTTSFNQLLTEVLLMLDYGHYAFEKVFSMRDGMVIWRKFAPRHPTDIYEWRFDTHGGLKGLIMRAPMDAREIKIPVDKLAIFSYEMEAGDVTGTSVLRSAYKHWYYKENMYKIDAIQKERHGIGIPMIVLPPNYTSEDKALAEELGRNLRTNEKAHVIVPPLWEVMFLKLEGQPVSALQSAEHHDLMIARNILGQFLNAPSGTSQEEQQQLFLKATRYIADTIRDVFNKYCIPQIVKWNWGDVDNYPELKVRRIGDTVDWRTISFAIRNFVGAGIITPDDQLEKWVRDELDLPKADPETARTTATPQLPGGRGGAEAPNAPGQPRVGPPRQSQAGNMSRAQNPGSNGNVGRDRSGGQ